MNLTAYRHLSIPWLVMRDGLRFMPEGSVEFEVAGHARDGEERTASATCRRVHTVAKQLRRQLVDDADHPTYILTEPRARLPHGEWGRAGTGEAM